MFLSPLRVAENNEFSISIFFKKWKELERSLKREVFPRKNFYNFLRVYFPSPSPSSLLFNHPHPPPSASSVRRAGKEKIIERAFFMYVCKRIWRLHNTVEFLLWQNVFTYVYHLLRLLFCCSFLFVCCCYSLSIV